MRSVLSREQYEALSRVKVAGRTGVERLVLGLIRCLPDISQINLHSRCAMVRRMDYPKREVLINVDSHLEYNTRVNSCHHEPDTIEWIEGYFRPGDVLYDVGANVGSYSLIASKALDGKIRIYGFEPGYMNYFKLCRNILLNRLQNVFPLHVALSDVTKLDTFFYDNDIIGNSGQYLGKPIDYLGKPFEPVIALPILAYRLDDFVALTGIPGPTHIKIDIDGIESRMLEGARRTLASPSLRTILIEMEDPHNIRGITDFIESQGLRFRSKREHVDPGVFNFIFVRESAP